MCQKDLKSKVKKMVPNDEAGFYELTILFKLKSKKVNVSSKKNKEFALKGWKKTPEKIAEEEQAKKNYWRRNKKY